jgi:hypothetical protein
MYITIDVYSDTCQDEKQFRWKEDYVFGYVLIYYACRHAIFEYLKY